MMGMSGRPPITVMLHADDFGMNAAVNAGVEAAFRNGLLTSTSILANGPAFDDATRRWQRLEADRSRAKLASRAWRTQLADPRLPFDLGVHLSLTEGRPLTAARYPRALLDRRGHFLSIGRFLMKLCFAGRRERAAIRAELDAQIRRVLAAGIVPTHLNGHQYIELFPPCREIVLELQERYGIGIMRLAREPRVTSRTLGRGAWAQWAPGLVKRAAARRLACLLQRKGRPCTDVFCGTCHAGRIDLALMEHFLLHVPPGCSVEIGLHPAVSYAGTSKLEAAAGWHDPLWRTRAGEYELLTSPALPALLTRLGCELGRLCALPAAQAA